VNSVSLLFGFCSGVFFGGFFGSTFLEVSWVGFLAALGSVFSVVAGLVFSVVVGSVSLVVAGSVFLPDF